MTEPDVVLMLRLEHRNLAKVLDILEHQLDRLERDGELDFELVEAVLAYFQSYPDTCHHPKEDLIYRRLDARGLSKSAGLKNLVEEHDPLAALTARSVEMIRDARARNLAPNEAIESRLRQFLGFNRLHMAMEEKYFFQVAEQNLSQEDWDRIEFDLFDRNDPVFDADAEHGFQVLRDRIRAMEKRAS